MSYLAYLPQNYDSIRSMILDLIHIKTNKLWLSLTCSTCFCTKLRVHRLVMSREMGPQQKRKFTISISCLEDLPSNADFLSYAALR